MYVYTYLINTIYMCNSMPKLCAQCRLVKVVFEGGNKLEWLITLLITYYYFFDFIITFFRPSGITHSRQIRADWRIILGDSVSLFLCLVTKTSLKLKEVMVQCGDKLGVTFASSQFLLCLSRSTKLCPVNEGIPMKVFQWG